jgi:tetratricopeptide (TPR) repeat protein
LKGISDLRVARTIIEKNYEEARTMVNSMNVVSGYGSKPGKLEEFNHFVKKNIGIDNIAQLLLTSDLILSKYEKQEYSHGDILFFTEHYKQAEDFYLEALQTPRIGDSDRAKICFNLAQLYNINKSMDNACKFYHMAIKLRPDFMIKDWVDKCGK